MEESVYAKNGDYGEIFNGLFILLFLFMQIQNKLYKKENEKRNENKIKQDFFK